MRSALVRLAFVAACASSVALAAPSPGSRPVPGAGDPVDVIDDLVTVAEPRVVPLLMADAIDGRLGLARVAGGVQVVTASPLARLLDLRAGDVVRSINGVAVDAPAAVTHATQLALDASRIVIVLDRGGARREHLIYLRDELGTRSPSGPAAAGEIAALLAPGSVVMARDRVRVDPRVVRALATPVLWDGVLNVRPGGIVIESQREMPALLGISAYDTILSIAGQPIATPSDVPAALAHVGAAATFSIAVRRIERELTITVECTPTGRLNERRIATIIAAARTEEQRRADVKALARNADWTPYVRAEASDRYRIDVAGLRTYLGKVDAEALLQQLRLVPSVRNGKHAGFKVYAMRTTSFAAAVGLSNGDTVIAIDGVALDASNGERILRGLIENRSPASRSVTVTMTRRGQPATLTWVLVQK